MPKQHGSTSTKKLLNDLRKKGFTVSEKNKRGCVKITPPIGIEGPIYHTHATESAFHQIRRDFRKHYKIDVG
jgi:hypothetical protein